MNDTRKHSWNVNGRMDRLVDGELSSVEYRELLQTMEDYPEGWKVCALAFLEHQALTRDFGEVHAERIARQTPEVSKRPASSETHINWSNIVAVAASFMIAFGLGIGYRGTWTEDIDADWGGGTPLASDEATMDGNNPLVAQPVNEPNVAPQSVPPMQPQGFVPVNLNPYMQPAYGQLNVPYYDGSVYRQLMAQQQTQVTIPPEVQQALRQAGQELRRNRQWMTVPVDDNRRVLVPVEQFEIVPVGRYQ